MNSPSLEELLDRPTAPNKPSEPQESPQTGEAVQPAAATERPHEGAQDANSGQQTGDKPNGATPAPEPATQEEERQVKAFQKAAEDERRKRQDSERAINELRQQNAELQRYLEQVRQQSQRPAQQPQPEFLDPEGVQYLQSHINQALQQQQQQIQAELYTARVEQSQALMRSQHPDYAEVEQSFVEAANRDPTLWEKLRAHPVPAQFAYQEGKRQKVLQQMGEDPEAYIAQRVEEAMAKIKAEQPAAPPPQAPMTHQAPTPPPSLAGVPSATARIAQAYQGPTPFEELFNQPINPSRRR